MTKKLHPSEKWAKKWARKYDNLKVKGKVSWNDWANMWQAIGFLDALEEVRRGKIK